MEFNSGIYQIRNLVNGKVYIGSAINFDKRKNRHKNELKKNIHSNSILQNSWNKYGEQNFIFEILEFVEDISKLLEKEQYWINITDCTSSNRGYNICKLTKNNFGSQSGEKNYQSILKKDDVDEIRKIYKKNELSMSQIALKYKVTKSCIQQIIENKTWFDFSYKYDVSYIQSGEKNPKAILNKNIVKEIRGVYFNKKLSYCKISRYYKVSKSCIAHILKNRSWIEDEVWWIHK